jgi:hypothetical protein
MEKGSIVPEEDLPQESQMPQKNEPVPLSKEGTERLSVFENFLDKLDFDKPGDASGPEEDKPDQPKKPKNK